MEEEEEEKEGGRGVGSEHGAAGLREGGSGAGGREQETPRAALRPGAEGSCRREARRGEERGDGPGTRQVRIR